MFLKNYREAPALPDADISANHFCVIGESLSALYPKQLKMNQLQKLLRGLFFCAILIASLKPEANAQCVAQSLNIVAANTVVGTAGAVGTKYRHNNVAPGVDAEFTIVSLNNGGTLNQEDDPGAPTNGYAGSWQPLVDVTNVVGSSGITWNINFFTTASNYTVPYKFNCLSVVALDVDGTNAFRDYAEFLNPYSYKARTGPAPSFSVTTAANYVRAESTSTADATGNDTTAANYGVIFQYNFVNVSSLTFTGGTRKVTATAGQRAVSLLFADVRNITNASTGFFNTDNDGIASLNTSTDLDDDNDGILDTNEYPAGYADPLGDNDGDGLFNYQDPTPGGTGVPTFVDANGDGINDNYDSDRDGIINSLDLDSDNDGIPDLVEAGGIDTNGDGVVDNLTDSDNDGLADIYDATAGGVTLANTDTDGDGIPNSRDLDSDNDGIPDVVEAGGTDANNDGRIDSYSDLDSDGLSDAVDGDVGNDGVAENAAAALILTSGAGGTPGKPASYLKANADGNGLPNPYDLDADGDGILDSREAGIAQDTNNDGVINASDTGFTDGNGDGWSDQVDALVTLTPTNTDGDGRPNYLDIDSDNDGIIDLVEGQTTAGFTNPTGTDTDGDGIDNAYDNVPGTFGGTAGNGVTPTNTDGVDTADYIDLDSDNDGKSDRLEGFDTNGNGVINGAEKAYVGTTDTDGDGLLDEYDTVNGIFTANNGTNGGTTPSTFPDVNNPGGDRDYRQITTCAGSNLLINGSFELPVQAGNGNHILAATFNIPGWRIGGGFAPNLVIGGGSYAMGPNNAQAGTQYLDIANGAGSLYQIIDITCPSILNFSGYFSSREASGTYVNWTARIDITTLNGTVVASSYSRNFTNADGDGGTDAIWYQLAGTTPTLAPGRYIYKVVMGDYGNFDNATVCTNAATCYKNPDADGDGVGSTSDIDDDNDGIKDLTENGGFDAYGDTDNDGVPNYADATPGTGQPAFTDTNSDGINDFYDTDKDGIINSEDLDTDGDGIPDIVEAGGIDINGDGRIDGTFTDTDGDGLANVYDTDNGGTDIVNLDTDGDGISNFKDLDSDNDGIPDVTEAGGIDTNNDGRLDNLTDTDADGLSDSVDGDVGNDGIAENTAGALIITSTVGGTPGRPASYLRANADGTGLANPYDLDADGDGILDTREAGIAQDTNNDGVVNSSDTGFTDANGDGWSDQVDALATLTFTNTDGDSRPNYLDIDSDNDGIIDLVEGQTTAGFTAPAGTDTDNDGIDNAYDNTPGTFGGAANNGVTPTNTDGTDTADYLDLDSDNDGKSDRLEGFDTNGNNFINGAEKAYVGTTDTDGDGLLDEYDTVNGILTANNATNGGNTPATFPDVNNPGGNRDWRQAADRDNDGVADNVDVDDDNDGITDLVENGGFNPFGDTDGDGILNLADPTPGAGQPAFVDANGDGINDFYDTDRDGVINSFDLDTDGDGIPDLVEAGGIDTNGDGRIDGTFTDTDGDGLANTYDTDNGGVNIANLDTDGDGIPNYKDLDSDGDGIPDVVEAGGIDANNDGRFDNVTDTDADGLSDLVDGDVGNDGIAENTAGALIITSTVGGTPGRPASYPRANADGNGLPNPYDLDSDGDGILDSREAGITQDTNNDGVVNSSDTGFTDANGDGWSDQVDALATLTIPNTDGDTRPNYLDIDSDNDGITDIIEGQTTAAYAAPSGTDTDGDGIDNAYDNVTGTFGGNANNGVTPVNTDGADTPDYIDLDADNDGKSDRLEGFDTNGNGVINGGERAYVGTTDTDGDGLLDEYDTVNGIFTANNTTNGNTPASFPDVNNPGGDRDWRQAVDTDFDGIPDNVDQDDDNDGIPDVIENAAGPDTDGDGIPNSLDLDSDNDGISDLYESGNAAAIAADTNSDGTISNAESAAGADGIPLAAQGTEGSAPPAVRDTDGDGKADPYDLDSDNDGINDLTEAGNAGIIDANSDGVVDGPDSDRDGINDSADANNTVFGDPDLNDTPRDTDGDGVADFRDLDSDNDGINDLTEAGNAGIIDANSDGVVDGPDTDGDGIRDSADGNNSVFGDPDLNDTPRDTDGDGIADYRDLDSDNDGINDLTEAGNAGIIDANSDGVVDGPDTDGDGVRDSADGNNSVFGDPDLNDTPRDTDGDGVFDFRDLDSDNDGINDLTEAGNAGIIDVNSDGVVDGPDTDGDGVRDSADGNNSLYGDPDLNDTPRDTDGDGVADYRDLDSDNDGINDLTEAGNVGIIDANSDGVVDGPDSDGDGVRDSADGNTSVFGDPDLNDTPRDTDGDGVPDYRDLDSDNDGINDLTEAGNIGIIDANSDGVVDGPDTDGDGIRNSADANSSVFGDPDLNDTPRDTDGDGVPDYRDLDSDNDGIDDLIEAGNPGIIDANSDGVVDGPDTDGDGIRDSADGNNTVFGDPDLNDTPRDSDGDGIADYRDLDSDNDGILDLTEAGNAGIIDANSDGVVDGPDTDGDGINDSADANPNVFGDPDTADAPRDTDGDGVPNYRDLDSDNDGINDITEAGIDPDTDGNGTVDGPDSDGDGIRDAADANDGLFGDPDNSDTPNGAVLIVNGTLLTGPDTDGDGILDAADGAPSVFGDKVPDLTPTTEIDNLSFVGNISRDFTVNIYEILNASPTGTISFRITRISGWDITVPGLTLTTTDQSGISGTTNVNGGTPNSNGNWLFRQNASQISMTLKAGSSIPANGALTLGFTATRKAGTFNGTSQNITCTIVANSGSEVNVTNNRVITTISAN